MLEPAHLFALREPRVAHHHVRPAVAKMQAHIEEMQADACHQHGSNRHQ